MNSPRFHTAQWALILIPLLLTFGAKSAIAQITPAADGTGTVIQTQNNQINISGGTQAGQNQFHSFQQFGINAGQTANFMANPNVANILGRVTGGDASLINGILKVSGSNANLFLINPNGIVFGKDASLNVPGAFTATTANGIGFGNGNWWSAVGPNNYASLTANPTSFGFIGTSGSLVNAGNLSVNPGQSIALVGGTVVNTGTIAAPGGDITIAAIPGEKMVRIGQAGTVLSLDLPTSDKTVINAPIATPLSLPALLTGGSIPSAMGVVVEDGVIKLTGGSASVTGTLNANGTGLQNGGNVIAYADNHLNFGATISSKGGELGGNGGFVDTSGKGSIVISPNAKVLTTALKGLTGTWLIDPADLEVVAGTGGTIGGTGSTIGAETIVTALNGTNVNLQADNSITVNAAIDASGNTNSGDLKLSAPTTNLNQAIVLKDGSSLSGTAATVNVGATGTVQNGVDVAATGGTVKLAAATYTLGWHVEISRDVTVQGRGASNSIVSGNNSVQVFYVRNGAGGTRPVVTLDGVSIVNGKAGYGGGIYNMSGMLTVSNSTISGNAATFGGGGIHSIAGTVTVSNSTLSGNSAEYGGGIVNDSGTLTVSNSTISGNSAQRGGGGIVNLSYPNNIATVTISNSTLSGNSGTYGGGIYGIGTLTIDNSTLSGNSAGNGGGIFISGLGESANLKISNSTLSGNSAKTTDGTGQGGGISNELGTLTIDNSTLSGNSAQIFGGGIYTSNGSLTLNNSTLSDNSGTYGGGIYNGGSGGLKISNSTLSGNSGTYGGGIYSSGTLTIDSSTLSGNSAKNSGGGINIFTYGRLTIGNSIVSGNIAPSGSEILGTFTSSGYNLFGNSGTNGLSSGTASGTDITPTVTLDQIIGPLANNGGPTQTHALIANSPAINAGNPRIVTPDQRGEIRIGVTDIGAFEWQPLPIIPTQLPIKPTPQPAESIQPPIDLTRNLKSSDPNQPLSSTSNSKASLCVAQNSDTQLQDPYKGIETCASKTP